eukprot:Tbor_TRINITY_DN5853_c1_g4::TRINITY_DN5853_c1_g4_i1::g.7035::m.7035
MKIFVVLGVTSVILSIIALQFFPLKDAEVSDMFNDVLTEQQKKLFLQSHLNSDKAGGDCYEDPASVGIKTPAFDETSQKYRWVRCKRPFADMNLPKNTTYLQSITQQKEFFAFYMTSPDYMVTIFLSKLGYSNAVQVKLINIKDGKSWKRNAELPVVAASHQVGPFFKPNRYGHRSPIAIGHCVEMISVPLFASGIDVKFCVQDSGKLRLDAAIMLDAAEEISTGGEKTKVNNEENGGDRRVLFKAVAEMDLSPKEWESLNFVWPVGPRRASVVHKSAGIPVDPNTIVLSIDNTNLIGNGNKGTFLCGIDYTRGLLGRKLSWDWTTTSFYTPELPKASLPDKASEKEGGGGKQKLIPYGFHFSRSVYDYIATAGKEGADNSQKNVSVESVFFYNGKMIILNEPVTVELLPLVDHVASVSSTSKLQGIPRKYRSLNSRKTQYWRITTKPYSDAVDLIFKPADLFFGNAHAIVCNVDYYLMFGAFFGVVPGPPEIEGGPFRQIEVSGAMGIVEEMDALW